jgi:FkbM family methyltransferase
MVKSINKMGKYMKTKFDINIYQVRKKDFKSAFVVNDLRFALFPKDNAITSSIIEGWQYEQYMFEFLYKNLIDTNGKDIIDVGGNNGNFAIDFAHMVGDNGKVHSFEPQRIIYYQLCGNVFMNGLDNVYCHNLAIGSCVDSVYIETPNYFEKGYVNFGNVKVGNKGNLVMQVPLDTFENDFKDVVFIKIDVQGYEFNVINGAINTINKHRPYLFVEFEDDLLQNCGTSEKELQEKIESLGYVVKRFRDGVLHQTTSGKCLDCVCIPKEKFEEFNHIIP